MDINSKYTKTTFMLISDISHLDKDFRPVLRQKPEASPAAKTKKKVTGKRGDPLRDPQQTPQKATRDGRLAAYAPGSLSLNTKSTRTNK